ncbi:MAG: hypothetical protein KC449_30440 [Anaerolineales bacterium]|nr:hypothetical protein [Anaerolineales bacterium]
MSKSLMGANGRSDAIQSSSGIMPLMGPNPSWEPTAVLTAESGQVFLESDSPNPSWEPTAVLTMINEVAVPVGIRSKSLMGANGRSDWVPRL